MLLIVNDPTGLTGYECHPLDPCLTLQANIAQHIERGGDYALAINGQQIDDPAMCAELDRMAQPCDMVQLVSRPGAAGAEFWVPAMIALIAAAVAYAMMPDASAQTMAPNEAGSTKNSPNNQLTGQTNIARAYQAVPDVYGQVRSYPDLVQRSAEEYIENVKYVTELMCFTRGFCDVELMRYSDTPLEDVTGASYEVFHPDLPSVGGGWADMPEYGTVTVPDVWEPYPSPEVNGQELVYPGAADWQAVTLKSITMQPGTPFATIVLTVKGGQASKFGQQLNDCVSINLNAPLISYHDSCVDDSGSEPPYPTLRDTTFSINQNLTVTSRSWFIADLTLQVSRTARNWPSKNPCFAPDFPVDTNVAADIQPVGSEFITVGPFIAPDREATHLRWNIAFLRGLKASVQINVQWWKINDSNDEISGTRESWNYTYTGDTYDQKFFTETVQPVAGVGRYRVQFRRLSIQQSTDGFDIAKIEALWAMRYYPSKDFPGCTMVRVVTPATDQAIGIRERKFNALITRHVLKRPIGGVSTFGPSRDFRDSVHHMFRVIAKRSGDDLDYDTLQSSGWGAFDYPERNYFDFTFDDKDVSLGDRIKTACASARVDVYRDGQRWAFTRDRKRAGRPVMQLDYRNLAHDGESGIMYRANLPTSHDGVKVEYVDPVTNKKTNIQLRIQNGNIVTSPEPDNPLLVELAGCRNEAQALNRAHYEVRRLLYSRVVVTDTVLADGMALNKGDLVRWIDPNDFAADDGMFAGEVMQIDEAGDDVIITTSEPVNFGSNATGQCTITNELGIPSRAIVCTPRTDGGQGFVVPYDQYAAYGSGWYVADDLRQCGSRYAMSPGFQDFELKNSALYLVADKVPTGEGSVQVELRQYDSRIYAEDGEIEL